MLRPSNRGRIAVRMPLLLIALASGAAGCVAPPQPDPRMSDPRFASAHYRCNVEYQKMYAATPGVGVAAGIYANNVYQACMQAEGFNR